MSLAPDSRTVPARAIATNRAVAALTELPLLLGCPVVHRLAAGRTGATDVVVGWGRKPSAAKACEFARQRGLPFWRLEDGFLRSLGMGGDDPPLSLVVDPVGIYYDPSAPSLLEEQILTPPDDARRDRANRLIASWREGGVSKYNHARDPLDDLPARYVLAIDQTLGDAAIVCGGADAASFRRMLAAALDEYPDCTVLLKVHPEVLAGRKQGYCVHLDVARHPRVVVLGTDVHPAPLIAGAEAIYTVTSQVGFEGLLWGRPVRTFGMPFYAGWGLTGDDLPPPERRRPVTLPALVHAALIDYPRYIDPETRQRCEAETVLAHLALQRRMRGRCPQEAHAVGFSAWKKPFVRRFLAGARVVFHRSGASVPPGGTAVLWGRTRDAAAEARAAQVIRVEDGFLRSVGLGVDLVQPLSWVLDRKGIYYDATAPSELEELLQTAPFPPALLQRAAALRRRIVAERLTKYNVGTGKWQRPAGKGRVVLVPGQVENDASIRYGSPGIVTNLALLQAVRQGNPDAWVVYKPHPDVASGLRANPGEAETRRWCDEVVGDLPMAKLFDLVDEVHVLTSLAGFEALLRDKRVVVYGRPFYAGWGLTEDRSPPERRTRRLPLDALVAAALILYPAYLSRATGRYTTPERALDELLNWRGAETPTPLWRKLWRLFLRSGLVRR